MFGFLKGNQKKKELDAIILRIEANMANNYKDAAQEALKELEEKLKDVDLQEKSRYSKKRIPAFYVS